MPTTAQFLFGLRSQLREAELRGELWIDIKAGDLHKAVGRSIRGKFDQMPMVCDAMREEKIREEDHFVYEPPKRDGNRLTIRYKLPRASLSDVRFRMEDAVNDLGSDEPSRCLVQYTAYSRDGRVRKAVLQRADGKCEYCASLGFERADGSRYLESHHIIRLADEGEDRLTNVIALCAGHHREAHFGAAGPAMEIEMEKIVKSKAFRVNNS